MMREEQHFVNVWDEVPLLQTTNEATHRNVIYKYTTHFTVDSNQ